MASTKLKFRKNEEFNFQIVARYASYVESTASLPNNTGLGYFRNLDCDSKPIFELAFKGTLSDAIDLMLQHSSEIAEDHHAYIVPDSKYLTYKQSVGPLKRELAKPESKIDSFKQARQAAAA